MSCTTHDSVGLKSEDEDEEEKTKTECEFEQKAGPPSGKAAGSLRGEAKSTRALEPRSSLIAMSTLFGIIK